MFQLPNDGRILGSADLTTRCQTEPRPSVTRTVTVVAALRRVGVVVGGITAIARDVSVILKVHKYYNLNIYSVIQLGWIQSGVCKLVIFRSFPDVFHFF